MLSAFIRSTTAGDAITRRAIRWLAGPVVLALAPALASAQQPLSQSPFYSQFHTADTQPRRSADTDLIAQIGGHDGILISQHVPRHQREDLAFNYLWLQQYRNDYKYRDGGAALGKLLRMGIRSMLRNHRGTVLSDSPDQDFSRSVAELDYHLRLHSDELKLGVEFEF